MQLTIISGELSKAHSTDAGFDIHSSEDVTVYGNDKEAVSTNLYLNMPYDSIGLVKPRSGLSFGKHIETGAGVIDEDYTGELKVKLYNNGSNPLHIKAGERIAQLVLFHRPTVEVVLKNNAIYNGPSDVKKRGSTGFGDSGK